MNPNYYTRTFLFLVINLLNIVGYAQKWEYFPDNKTVKHIEYLNDTVWLVTNSTVMLVDTNGRLLTTFDRFNGLPAGRIDAAVLDKKKQLWLVVGQGRDSNFLCCWTGKAWVTTPIPKQMKHLTGFIADVKEGVCWVTYSMEKTMFCRYQNGRFSTVPFRKKYKKMLVPNSETIADIHLMGTDNEGWIWAGAGYFKDEQNVQKIFRYKNKKIEILTKEAKSIYPRLFFVPLNQSPLLGWDKLWVYDTLARAFQPLGLEQNHRVYYQADAQGKIWSASNDSIFFYEKNIEKFLFTLNVDSLLTFFSFYKQSSTYINDQIKSFTVAPSGTIWIGTAADCVCKHQAKTTRCFKLPVSISPLYMPDMSSPITTADGRVLFSNNYLHTYQNGQLQVQGNQPTNYPTGYGTKIEQLSEDAAQQIWGFDFYNIFKLEQGKWAWKFKNYEFKKVCSTKRGKKIFLGDENICVILDSAGTWQTNTYFEKNDTPNTDLGQNLTDERQRVWWLVYKDLKNYRKQTSTTLYQFDGDSLKAYPSSFFEDSSPQFIWQLQEPEYELGLIAGKTVWKLHKTSQKWVSTTTLNFENSYNNYQISKQGGLWAKNYKSFFRINPLDFSIKTIPLPLPKKKRLWYVTNWLVDKKGRLWVVATDGFWVWEQNTWKYLLKEYRADHTFLMEDAQGSIWFFVNSGNIYKYNPEIPKAN